MRLFNTLTQSLETLSPIGDTICIYVCGVTPYDTTHLGHAFTYISFDALIRYLEFRGQKVKYVQNVTDIDDDVLRKAREVGMPWDELGRRETARFLKDLQTLNWRAPDVYARATDEIPRIIELVKELVERGNAYVSEGCVFYDVQHDPDFGALGRAIGLNNYEAMLQVANERGNFPDDKRKRDPLDFVLWQAQAPGEPAWESPWGPGRPGWHIECSSMVMHYLAEQIDIHGGGFDLAFPHHTCEIAQSEHVTGRKPFVRHWMHTAMVYQDGEKMSKSLGNLTLVADLLKDYTPDAIRLVLLNHHYRESWELTLSDLQAAHALAERFQYVRSIAGRETQGENLALRKQFQAHMENDLNTPGAIALLKQAAEMVSANHDIDVAIEILRLTGALGLCI
jgi:cysteinyl-tRNA synthetase